MLKNDQSGQRRGRVPMHSVSVRFAPEDLETIRRVALVQDRPVTQLVRRAVRLYLAALPDQLTDQVHQFGGEQAEQSSVAPQSRGNRDE